MSVNINLSIIDQQLLGIEKQIQEQAKSEPGIAGDQLKSLAFVYLCVRTMLDLEPDETFDCLTDGHNDLSIDAITYSIPADGEIAVTLFQAKYQRKLNGESQFGENEIKKLIDTCGYLFDPRIVINHASQRLLEKIEEIRSYIRDGSIPRIRIILCNNGRKWNDTAQETINRFGNTNYVTWEHVNHDVLVNILQRTRPVDDIISFAGKTIIEDMNYSRVCIGRVAVSEVARLMKTHGDKILERNIRSYLGLHGNRVNEDIRLTLLSNVPSNFYFFNNGLTVICKDFIYSALQTEDHKVRLKNLQIVNGGQTCMTILKTDEELQENNKSLPDDAYVLVRIYKLSGQDELDDDIVSQITHATNSQNPVDLRDLRANDEKQKRLALSIGTLGYSYRRKRSETAAKSADITTGTAALAVLSVWRGEPHRAKFYGREHFGKLYHQIFTDDLNGTQVIAAVLLYRFAENRRRRPSVNDPVFVPYASCFLAMLMGRQLLKDMKISDHTCLDHRNFNQAASLLETNEHRYFDEAVAEIDAALKKLYGNQENISMQQLSATFRRGDLIALLNHN